MPHLIVCGACGFEFARKQKYIAELSKFYIPEDKREFSCPKCNAKLRLDLFDLEITPVPKRAIA